MDWDGFPVILGFGSCHDMEDKQPEHRFWRFKSTSRAAAQSYSQDAAPKRQRIGFHRPQSNPRQFRQERP